jgi:transposase InsO family protein
MSRRGNPYDNAQCESFMKTLKYEEVYRNEYRDLAEARAHRLRWHAYAIAAPCYCHRQSAVRCLE